MIGYNNPQPNYPKWYDPNWFMKIMTVMFTIGGTFSFFYLMYNCSDTFLCYIPFWIRFLIVFLNLIGLSLIIYEYFAEEKDGKLFRIGIILSSPVIFNIIIFGIYNITMSIFNAPLETYSD